MKTGMVTRRSLGCLSLVVSLGACTNEVGGTPSGDATVPEGIPGAAAAGTTGTTPTETGVPTGTLGAGGGGGMEPMTATGTAMPGSTPCADPSSADSGATVLRRLTNLEYELTVAALLQRSDAPDITALPADAESQNFRTVAEFQTVSSQHLRGYIAVAGNEAAALMADATRRQQVIGCDVEAAGCLDSFVRTFGRLAYRRALADVEVTSLVEAATVGGTSPEDQFQFVIEALLSSSNFLFRVEIGDQPEGLSTLTPEEVASRLSFTLWGRGPSAALLDRAVAGDLSTQAGLLAVANEMLADPKTREYYTAFFEQWLDYGGLRPPEVSPEGWSDDLIGEMADETLSVVDDFAWGGGDVLDMLTANYTYASDDLAEFYDLPAPVAGRVEFPADHPRYNSGLLTHPSLIAAKTDGDLISIRGNWLRKTFLCKTLEVPQGLLDSLGDELAGLSAEEIVARRNDEGQCAGCHAVIDPIGIGYAAFDRLGRFDPEEDITRFGRPPGLPDAADPAFSSIGELASKLQALEDLPTCLANRVFLFSHGREPAGADRCSIESASSAFTTSSHRFDTLIAGLVNSPAFRTRRAPAAAQGATP